MNRGGAEMRTLEVMRGLDRSRFHFEFNALSGRHGTLDDQVRAMGGEIHHVPLGPAFPAAFIALLRRRRIDVVHSHVHLASGAMLALAALAGVRCRIAHFRSTQDDRGHSLPRGMYRRVMRHLLDGAATTIVGCGRGALAQGWNARWEDDPRCRVIYNAIDPQRFAVPGRVDRVRAELGLQIGESLVVHIGRLEYPKNPARSVKVVARALDRQAIRLVFVGRGGDEESRVRATARALGVSAHVQLLGEREDIPTLLHAADAMLLTSTHEGIPGVVLEARAAGTPVISSDLPGVREIAEVLGGIQTLPLAATDDEWAAMLLDALASPPSADERAVSNRQLATSPFGIDTAIAQHERLYVAGVQ